MKLPEAIHFIGIGGAGMAPMAELLLARGVKVSGSDLAFNEKCRHLEEGGAVIRKGHASENVPDDTGMIVFSSAVTEDNPERIRGRELNIPEMRRGEFLAFFLSLYRRVAAVSGSHGKSSITAMLVHILLECGFHPGYMIGAAVPGGKSSDGGADDDIFVTEADESDATHKLLSPYLGIVPNVDGDHAWSVGGDEALKENFRIFARRSEKVLCFDTEKELFSGMKNLLMFPFPSENETFACHCGFMALNARLAVESAVQLGCDRQKAIEAVSSYKGISRRMTLRRNDEKLIVIEDYAHHPKEVERAIDFLRIKYPECHLRIVFQPHRFARLEKFFDDFVRVLRGADSLFTVPVFAAWTESGKVDSAMLAGECGGIFISGVWQENAEKVLVPPEDGRKLLIAVLGAGDIEEIIPYL